MKSRKKTIEKRDVIKKAKYAILLFSSILVIANSYAGQAPPEAGQAAPGAGANKPNADPKPDLSVVEVYDSYKLGREYEKNQSDSAAIDEIIVLKVRNLESLMNRSKGIDVNGKSIPEKKIRLFLDGRMIEDLDPESGDPDKEKEELRFHLKRSTKNDEAWADILGSPKKDEFFYRRTRISVGLEDGSPVKSTVNNFYLTRAKENWFYGCAIGLVFYFIGLLILAHKSNILKDNAVDANSIGLTVDPTFNHYSLGKFQMAFWFSLVLISYLFIWLITGATDIISAGVLGLIGISAGTALSAVVINNSKSTEILKLTSDLQSKQAILIQEIANIDVEIATAPEVGQPALLLTKKAKEESLKQVQAEISKNIGILTPDQKSKGFILDILSDENGVSFHRLQMFVWTLVLGVLFIHSVWTRLSMLEFSATLLALQGLTAGTYLGFKIPEKQV